MKVPRTFRFCTSAVAVLACLPWLSSSGRADSFFKSLERATGAIKNLERAIPRDSGGGGNRNSGGGGSSRRDRGNHDDDKNDNDSDDSSSKSASKSDSSGASLEKVIADSKNIAAFRNEIIESNRAQRMEEGRNVATAITGLIKELQRLHREILEDKDANVKAATGLNVNQVTAGELRPGLEEAYRQSKLGAFERFSGELWTRDRLMVSIVNQAKGGLVPYFQGVGARGPTMAQINELFARSAKEMYANALEINEVIGVSLSFDRFVRVMYENADKDTSLWEADRNGRFDQPDSKYERVATMLINRVTEGAPSLNSSAKSSDTTSQSQVAIIERQFLYRFRARRAIFDCLNSHYTEFVGKAPSGKVIEAGYDTSKGEKPAQAPAGWWSASSPSPAKPVEKSPVVKADDAPLTNAFVVELMPAGLSKRVLGYVQTSCGGAAQGVQLAVLNDKIEPISGRADASAELKSEGTSGLTQAADRPDQ